MSTLRTVLQEVAKRHYSFILPDTVSGINVEMDEVAQPLDQHRMVIHKDVLEQGQISTTTDGRYYLRRQIHLAFLSKIRLDERGIQRLVDKKTVDLPFCQKMLGRESGLKWKIILTSNMNTHW